MKAIKLNESLKATIYYVFGNIIGQGVALVGIVLFSRLLTKQAYGMVSTYNASVQIVSSFIGLNLFFGLRNAFVEYKDDFLNFRSSVMTLSLLVFIIISIPTIIGLYILGYQGKVLLWICILIQSFAIFVITYFDNSLSMMRRYKSRTLLLILPNVGHTIFSIFLIVIMKNNPALGKILGNVSFLFIIAIILIWIIYSNGNKIVNKNYWKYSLNISVPSILQSMSNIVIMQCDQIMITYFVSAEETAVYSIVYYVGFILYAILTATSSAWIPWFYQKMDNGNTKNICKVQKWYIFIFVIMATGLYMIGPEIVKVIAPKTYWYGSIYAGPFIMSSFIMLLNSFFAYLFLFYKKAYITSVATLIAAFINIILNFIFIPIYGGIAAMFSTVLSYIILFLIYYFCSKKMVEGIFLSKYFIKSLIIIFLECFIYFMVYRTVTIRYLVYFFVLVVLACYSLKNKREILQIVRGGN